MPTPTPPTTDHEDFERQLLDLRRREKTHTREGDRIAAARRRLPMTPVAPDTTVLGPNGPVPFAEVFDGRDELVVYSHMFHGSQPWERQCEGCTRNTWNMGDADDAAYLNANGITFAVLVDGPYDEIAEFRDFMGYTVPWYSNAHVDDPTVGVPGRISCYLRRGDDIFLTYWTTGRGDEVLSPSFGLLDMTAYGRREEWEDSPDGWPQRPTHAVLRADEDGTLIGPGDHGRPVPQWTRPGIGRTTFVAIGYGDHAGYERTDPQVRDVAHANDARLRAAGARMGIAEEPVQIRNPGAAGVTATAGPFMRSDLPVAGFSIIDADTLETAVDMVSRTPCAIAHGVVELWPIRQ